VHSGQVHGVWRIRNLGYAPLIERAILGRVEVLFYRLHSDSHILLPVPTHKLLVYMRAFIFYSVVLETSQTLTDLYGVLVQCLICPERCVMP
jgi:hypothetical protein